MLKSVNSLKELIDRLKQITLVTHPQSYLEVSKENIVLKHEEN